MSKKKKCKDRQRFLDLCDEALTGIKSQARPTVSLADIKKPPPRTVGDFFEDASMTIRQRGKEYDQPSGERSARAVAIAFNAITKRDLTEAEIWLILQIVKDVRQFTGPYHEDSTIDCIAYATLKAEALACQT